jgi:subtilisin-like proprotein convertase family protein
VLALIGAGGLLALLAAGVATASSGLITVTNSSGITINDNAPATPYPSSVVVAHGGAISGVTLTLSGFQHTYLDDVLVRLTSPTGQSVTLIEDQGGSGDVCGSYTFVAGATPFPDGATGTTAGLCSGSPGWAPGTYGPFGSFAAFLGAIASGTWSLYVEDDAGADVGSIQAWALSILALFPDRAGYCAVDGNRNPFTGESVAAGTFLDLTLDQVGNDPAYAGARIANYVDGVGITCDPVPAGFVQSGFASDALGVPANTYPFYKAG